MSLTFFGKRMRTTNDGFRYSNKTAGVHVAVVRLFNDTRWRHNVTFGEDCWLQSSALFPSAEAAAADIEARVRALRADLNRLIPRRAR
jgi:hypothetical protein